MVKQIGGLIKENKRTPQIWTKIKQILLKKNNLLPVEFDFSLYNEDENKRIHSIAK